MDPVFRLLLTDRGSARSFAYQLDRLADDLAHLPIATGAEASAEALAKDLDEMATRRARLANVTLAGAVAGRRVRLAGVPDDAGVVLRRLGQLIEAAHFVQPAPLHALGPLGDRHPA